MYSAEIVWGLAIAAYRTNGEYLQQSDEWSSESPRMANKTLIKTWLYSSKIPSDDDILKGIDCRNHVKGYLLYAIAGTITPFQNIALQIAQLDEFTNHDLFELAMIACLPLAQEMDKVRTHVDLRPYTILPGEEGDLVCSVITILNCKYNTNYRKYRVTALLEENVVEFWYRDEVTGKMHIEARIKTVNEDYSTQLNCIKRLTPID